MDYKEYLSRAKKPEIRINGLTGTAKILKRPSLNKLKSILKDRNTGSIIFSDSYCFEITKDTIVNEGQLFYDGELMATYKTPNIHLEAGDILTWTFQLTISCKVSTFGKYEIHLSS